MNEISITWTSDQKQLIADMKQRQLMTEKEVLSLQHLAGAGKLAGNTMTGAYKETGKELDRLGRLAESSFKKPVTAMDAHLARLKEIRVLYRLGKIDLEQFNKASAESLKQKYVDNGGKDRLQQMRKEAIASQTALTETYKDSQHEIIRLGKVSETAFQKPVSAMDTHLARLKEIRVLYRMGKIDLDQFNKASADSLKQKYVESGDHGRLQQRRKEIATEAADLAKLERQKKQAAADERQRSATFYAERRRIWDQSAEQQKAANQSAADSVRRSMMSERDLARANYRERMRQLGDLRSSRALSDREYTAAAKQAYDEWGKISKLEVASPWKGVPSVIGGAITATAALSAAVRIARAEFENLKEVQKNAATATMTYAEAQNAAVQNLPQDGSFTSQQLDDEVFRIAEEKSVSAAYVMRGVSNVLGTRPAGVTPQQAINSVGTAIDFNRFDQTAMNFTANAIMQGKAVRPDASDEAILGQQKSAKIASPVVNDADFSRYLVPYASSSGAYQDNKGKSDSERDSYAFMSVLGSRMGDTEGRVASSAFGDFRKDLDKIPELRDVQAGPMGVTIAKLQAIAQDPKYAGVRDHLLGRLEGGQLTTETRAHGPLTQLIQNNPKIWQELNEKHREILDIGPEAEALVSRQRQDLHSLPAQRTAMAEQGVKAEIENSQIKNSSGARASISREALQETLKNSGAAYTDQWMSGLAFETNTSGGQDIAVEEAVRQLRKRASPNEKRVDHAKGIGQYLWQRTFGGTTNTRGSTSEENRTNELLLRVAETLERLVKEPRNQPLKPQENAIPQIRIEPPTVNVNVNMPGGGGKPAPSPALGLGQRPSPTDAEWSAMRRGGR